MYLKFKFMQSFKLFEIKTLKILYIRNYCKNTIYDIIKVKINLKNSEHYVLANNII